MYKAITIRRMKNKEEKELMKACNLIEKGIRIIKKNIKSKQVWHKLIKNIDDPVTQKKVDDIFGQRSCE
jgi:hypothetical protein